MKKLAALLVLFSLLLPWAALAGEDVTLMQKTATRSGPGTQYTEETGVLTPPATVTVVSQTDSWYHIEYTRGGKTYRAYILKSKAKGTFNVPWENTGTVPDTVLYACTAFFGPGETYAPRRTGLPAGASVKVAQVEGEWALCEYKEDGRWARGYVPVSALENTEAGPVSFLPAGGNDWSVLPDEEETYIAQQEPTPTQAPAPQPAPEQPLAGQPLNAETLPQVNAAAIYFFTSPQDIYAGPGFQYTVQTPRSEIVSRGVLNAGVRAYGQENGWVLIRYPSGEPGEYYYGWVTPEALSAAGGADMAPLPFASVPAVTREGLWAAFDPDIIREDTLWLPQGAAVTALACLNSDPAWVYCEYARTEESQPVLSRVFLPAEALIAW